MKTRISRPCYDKPHRCPGWAGGGMKRAKTYTCANGSIRTHVPEPGVGMKYPAAAPWHFGFCNHHTSNPSCGVITLPWATRYLDPTWHWSKIRDWWRWRKK